jgi:hypothetical protein
MKKDNYSHWDSFLTGKDEQTVKKQKGFELFNRVLKLVKEQPNDEDLGKKVRELILTSVEQNLTKSNKVK